MSYLDKSTSITPSFVSASRLSSNPDPSPLPPSETPSLRDGEDFELPPPPVASTARIDIPLMTLVAVEFLEGVKIRQVLCRAWDAEQT